MIDKNAMITTTPNEIVTKLVQKAAAIMGENGLTPEALFFAKMCGKGGKGGKDPTRNKTINRNHRNEKNQERYILCQRRGHITGNCFSMQQGDSPMAANTIGKASAETTSNLTTSIRKYWMAPNPNASCSDWFNNCGCMTPISKHQLIFITCNQYPPIPEKAKGFNVVISFESGSSNVMLIRQLPDGMLESVILQDVVQLLGSFSPIV